MSDQKANRKSRKNAPGPPPPAQIPSTDSLEETLRKRAEQALQESENRFRTLIEHIPEGVIIVDKDDRIQLINQRVCEMLGYEPAELTGKISARLFFSKSDRQWIHDKNRLRARGIADRYEIQMRKKSGERIWVALSGAPLVNADGEVTGSVGIISDIHRHKIVEAALKKSRDELEKRVAERTRELQRSNEKLKREIRDRIEAEKRLKKAETALQKAKQELELRVRERTAELERTNENLRQQIQERRRAEEQLQESEMRYRLLFNSGNDAVLVFHPGKKRKEEHFIEVNDVACKKLGYRRKELLRLTPEALSLKRGARDTPRRLQKLLDQHHILYEDLFLTKKGNVIPVEVSAHLFELNEKPTVMLIARDITLRKRAQDQIQEQAALLDKAQDAILVCDLNDYIIYWNKSATRLYGWRVEEALGNNAFELLFGPASSRHSEARRAVLKTGEWQGEMRQITKSGKEIIVESRWTLVQNNTGDAKSILIVNTDVTEKKKIEAQFLRAQRMDSIGALAGGIAHDLNNVFAPIMTAVEVLQVRYANEERNQRILNTIASNVRRGSDMVKQILSFARGVEGERAPLNMAELIFEIERILQETFPKSINIRSKAPKNLWMVSGDATQLHQVLLNLCVNARDAMPEGGMLKIEARNVKLDREFTSIHLNTFGGKYVLIQVIDTGVGIPADIIDRIFEPFFTTKESGKGTGLGLSTAIAIVNSHRGLLNVQSEVGKGTTFEIYLPAATEEDFLPAAAPEAADLPRGNGELILLVDDETSILDITKMTLETYGYTTMIARDGAEAVGLYARNKDKIALVITDMMMPVMDGIATIRALRELNPHVKIIASSGYLEDAKISQFIGREMEAFLQKPYSNEQLLTLLHRQLHDRNDKKMD